MCNRFVSESALTSRIKAARRAIGDDGRSQLLIRTVHGRGYQFVGAVHETVPSSAAADASVPISPPPQRIGFCTTADGVRLAYASMGAGPPLVEVARSAAFCGASPSRTTLRLPCGRAWMTRSGDAPGLVQSGLTRRVQRLEGLDLLGHRRARFEQ